MRPESMVWSKSVGGCLYRDVQTDVSIIETVFRRRLRQLAPRKHRLDLEAWIKTGVPAEPH